jgi:DNA repair protein RecN (Recombination protein N)
MERQREAAAGLFDEVCEAFDRALVELSEAERLLDETEAGLQFDPRELEEVEERLFALRAAARKHRVQVEQLPGLAAELAGRLAALDDASGALAGLEKEVKAARAAYMAAAEELKSPTPSTDVTANLPTLNREASNIHS